jgi:hypothetical protein
MISWLKRVIALLSGTKAEHSEAIAQPTQTAGLVHQEPTTPHGNKRSALTTAPVQTEQKPKRSRARRTTAEASPKQERTTAKRTAIQPGLQQATPVSQTPQPAPTPTKRGRKRAAPTK